MCPTVSQYARALEELSQENVMPLPVVVRNFSDFLKRQGESKKFDAIVKQLEKTDTMRSGKLSVIVATAYELSPETKVLLTKKAEDIFPGKTAILSYEVKKDIIGGVCFRTDEILYDITIATELSALKKVIQK